MPDRERKDGTTRDRVDEIAAANEAWRERVDLRYRRVIIVQMVIALAVIVTVALTYLFLQGSRWEQTRDACERTNQQTDATIGLLMDLGARGHAIDLAKARYPHVPPLVRTRAYRGPLSCADSASERIPGFRL